MGPRTALGLLPRAAAVTLALGTALTLALGTALTASASAAAATATVQTRRAAPGAQARALVTADPWARAWSWRSGSRGLPNGCAPYSGRSSADMRWSPSLVRIAGGRLRFATSGGRAGNDLAGSGMGCQGRAQRYARVKVRARMPQGGGLVARIALWPSTPGRGSDWSGLTVPSVDLGPAYATNGTGDETSGAEVPARLAGAFHDYLITWSPQGFSVAIDGRAVYQNSQSFDRPRWLGISLSTAGPSTARADLVVEQVVAYSWTGLTPAAMPAPTTAPATGSREFQGVTSPLHDPAPPAMIALGVLLGIVRAARAARQRRPLTPG